MRAPLYYVLNLPEQTSKLIDETRWCKVTWANVFGERKIYGGMDWYGEGGAVFKAFPFSGVRH